MDRTNEVISFEETDAKMIPDLDPEMTNHIKNCMKNLVLEVEHLKDFLKDKDESYIYSNPEEVANELIGSALSAAHIMGGYHILEGIRETGMVPRISFTMELPEVKK